MPGKVTKGSKKSTKKSQNRSVLANVNNVRKTIKDRSLGAQYDAVFDPLTHEDEALHAYAITISNPWVEDPAGVPLALGFNSTRTLKPQLKYQFDMTANASGFACAMIAMDGWIEAVGLTTYQSRITYASYSGGTQGTPIFYTGATYVGATTPAYGATTATTGLYSVPLTGGLDAQVTDRTNIRLVAAGMRVFNDTPIDSAGGKVMLVSTSQPFSTGGNGSLHAATYASLFGLPADLASVITEPLAGWNAKHSLHTFAIPSDPDCFEMWNPSTTGNSSCAFPQMCVIMAGAQPNQTLSVEVVFDYEFTIGDTRITGVDANPSVTVDGGRITNVLSKLPGLAGELMGTPRPHVNGVSNGVGTAAAMAEIMGHKGPSAVHSMLTKPSTSSVFGNLINTGMKYVSSFKKPITSAISYIPYVGSALSSLLSKIW